MTIKEERKIDAENGHIKELKDKGYIVDRHNKTPYVFISYSSSDWKQAIYEIVYNTCKKYGMRVYFDANFDIGSDSWITQFFKNMKDDNCQAVLAFLSPEYKSSYACLMELMASQTLELYEKMLVLPINLGSSEVTSTANTGLGTERFADNSQNVLWKSERDIFNNFFNDVLYNNNRVFNNTSKMLSLWPFDRKNIDRQPSYKEELTFEALKNNQSFWRDKGIDSEEAKEDYWKNNMKMNEKESSGEVYLSKKKNAVIMEELLQGLDKNLIDGRNKKYEDSIFEKLKAAGCAEGKKNVFDKKLIDHVHHNSDISDIKVSYSADGKTYRIGGPGKKYDAYYRKSEGKYIVLRGSRIRFSSDWTPKKYKDKIREDGILSCDIPGLSISTAAKLIKGISTAGKELLNEKNLLKEETLVQTDNLFVREEKDIKDTLPEETVSEIKITEPVGLGALYSDNKVKKKKSKLKLEEMVREKKVSDGAEVFVKGNKDKIGLVTEHGRIKYQNQEISLNKYVEQVLGSGSRNAYLYVYLKETGKCLDELR